MQPKKKLDQLFTSVIAGRPVQVICEDGETLHYLSENEQTWFPVPNYTVGDLMPWLATFPRWRIAQFSEGFYRVTVILPPKDTDADEVFEYEHPDLAYALLAAMLASKGIDAYAD